LVSYYKRTEAYNPKKYKSEKRILFKFDYKITNLSNQVGLMCAVYYVYILETKGKKGKKQYYTGYTKNLYRRIEQHKSGQGAKFCKGKKVKLEYFESYLEQGDAMRRELEIKELSHEEKKELINTFQKE